MAHGAALPASATSDLAGRKLLDFHPVPTQELIRDTALPATVQHGIWNGESSVLAADGTPVPVSQVIVGHRDSEGRLRFRSTIARDIRDRKAYEARIQHMANYDLLTGMPNRSLLGDRAVRAIAHAKRSGRACGLIVLNIDRFKLLNDSYGHAAGDTLLKLLAERVTRSVREVDTTARLGADVFAVLAVDLARPDDILAIARKIPRMHRHCVRDRGPRGPRFVERRGEHLSKRRRRLRAPAAQRRCSHASGEGRRRQLDPVLRLQR
jgi:GGDEF domain-containing protein